MNNTETQKYDDVHTPAQFKNIDDNPSYKHIQNSSLSDDYQNQDPQHCPSQQNYPLYEDPDECLRAINPPPLR